MKELINFQEFTTAGNAKNLAEQLKLEHIPVEVVKTPQRLNTDYVSYENEYEANYILKIPVAYLEQATKVLYANISSDAVDNLNPNHPLQDLTNEELQGILAKPAEWGPENYKIALCILKKRGIEVLNNFEELLEKERLRQIAERKPFNRGWIILGYCTAILTVTLKYASYRFAIPMLCLPGLVLPLGIFLFGFAIGRDEIKLYNGQVVPKYSGSSTLIVRFVLILNLIVWILNLYLLVH